MKTSFNWGIMGCGRIASVFAQGLRTLKHSRITGVASLTPEKADRFAKAHQIPKVYTKYESLAEDPDIDIVYVATLHNAHYNNTLLALNSGKHVLCEKPFTLNADQAKELIKTARAKKLFLMEAMWTRFLPASQKIRQLIDQGEIGEIQTLRAEFGFYAPWNPNDRLHNLNLAGGALLDIGVYPVSYAHWIFGEKPQKIYGSAYIGSTHVDEHSSYLLTFTKGRSALLFSSFNIKVPNEALIAGSKGFIRIPNFFKPTKFRVHDLKGKNRLFRIAYKSTGLQYQAKTVMDCISKGEIESSIMPLNETLEIMETLDTLRSQWRLVYPEEKTS